MAPGSPVFWGRFAWDRLLTSSPWHGVTTVVMGNCGVGVAPVKPATRDILLHDLVHVEAMPYEVMQAGIERIARHS